MIISMAVVSGFKSTIRDKMFVFWGQIEITPFNANPSYLVNPDPISYNDTLVKEIRQVHDIRSIHPFILKPAILHAENGTMEGLKLKGISPGYPLKSNVIISFDGQSINFKTAAYSKDIILSQTTLNRLKAKVGDTLLAFFLNPDQQFPRVRKLNIVGTYHTGMSEVDQAFALCDIRLLRRISNWDSIAINGYQVSVNDYKKADAIGKEIYKTCLKPPLYTSTMEDIYPNIYGWLGLMDTNAYIILIIMAVVSVINLSTALLIFILERTNMSGILKSMGMPQSKLQGIFLYHATMIAFKGIVFGTISGLAFCLLQQYFPFIHLDESAYYMKNMPIRIIAWQVILIDIGTLVFCLVFMLLPSLFVRRISLIKAIRFR